MTDATALLAAILSDPASDDARLVYADCLEDNGQPERAAFIRVQVELARVNGTQDPDCRRAPKNNPLGDAHGYIDTQTMKPVPCVDCWAALRARERELWSALSQAWVNSARPLVALHLGDVDTTLSMSGVVSRGFVSRITCTSADWLRHADSLCWRPGQTMDCPSCYGSWAWRPYKCRCGTGRVPRPMPPGAQPIERVVLSGWDFEQEWGGLSDVKREEVAAARPGLMRITSFKSDRWPGIVFEVRPGVNVDTR